MATIALAAGEAVLSLAFEAALSVAFESIFGKLSSQDVLKYARRNNVETEVKQWENFLRKMRCVLDDAEERQMRKGLIKIWLDDLRDLAYDVEDILDEFSTEVLREKVMAETEASPTPSKVRELIRTCCSCVSSPRDIKFNVSLGLKMKEITLRFERLTKEKEDLKLTESTATVKKVRLETTCLPESHVYGRETDKKTLISKLLSSDSKGEPFSVVAIVGMGGLGKTTLAQLLYNDDIVKTSFDIKAWVCVSDEFDVFKITVKILEGFTSSPCDAKDLNSVQVKLRDTLQGKKFLLILDDVWNKNYSQWDALSRPLAAGGLGSKVLITTRNEDVATTAGAVFMYVLNKLKPEECSSLLARHALGENDFSRHPTLQEMGEEIAKKCDGLPLAAKAIGGLLRGKSNPTEWSTVLKSNMWELPQEECPILPALRLSYHYLPSHLKRCFAYCAIFPKDYEFDKDDLILWWMAEGFLEQSTDFMEVGDWYFKDLLSRSFFQRLTSDEGSKFVMHDLMNDLAMWISGGTCLHLLCSKERASGMANLRHLSFMAHQHDVAKQFEKFSSSTRLRTFIAFNPYHFLSFSKIFIWDNMIVNMRCLKLLCLSGYKIQKLPDSISELKQLRHFDISFTKVRLLPESISGLLNLQILKLNNCERLIQLPREIRKLVNLRLLDISRTPKLKKMPSGIGRLTNLQILPKFIIGENHGLRLKELKGLPLIRGELSILKLENMVDIQDARDANLKSKEGLVSLQFSWTEETRDVENEKDELILAELEPHTSLKSLEIAGYNGKHFPKWVGDCSFTKLETLTLRGCKSASSLPHLGGLISLKTLEIDGMNGLEEWRSGFGGGDEAEVVFPLLQKMYIRDCPVFVGKLPNQLPLLAELSIEKCSNLTNLPNQLPFLGELRIRDCPNLTNLLNHLPSLAELNIEGCPNLTNLPNQLPLLAKLRIRDCPNLTNLLNHLPSLAELNIEGCPNLTNLPNQLPLLAKLRIRDCPNLTNLLDHLPSLAELNIKGCSNLTNLPNQLPLLGELSIEGCPNLTNLPNQLPFLGELSIEGCPNLINLPNQLPLLSNLRIRDCPILKNLPNHLPSLADLSIEGCSDLTILPNQLPLLEELRIEGCLKLTNLECRHPSLRKLFVKDCSAAAVKTLGSFSSLKILELENITELICMDDGLLSMLGVLQYLSIARCRELKTLVRNGKGLEGMVGLKKLNIRSCDELEALVGEGDQGLHCLPSLESLQILGADKLVSFGPMRLPSSLKYMTISYCNALKCLPEGFKNMMDGSSSCEFALETLEITHCNSLTTFPGERFPGQLVDLKIDGGINLEIMQKFSDSIESLEITGGYRLQSLPRLSASLVSLKINNLQSSTLRSIAIEKGTSISLDNCASSLEDLYISNLGLRRLSKNITTSFRRMKRLEIWSCYNLRGLPKQMQELTCLEKLTITVCPNLKLSTRRDLPRQLTHLEIYCCEKVTQGLFDGGLSTLSSLTKLVIKGWSCGVVNIKQGSPAFLPKLEVLEIGNLGNLESLATAFHFQLSPSVERLIIDDCPKLRELPSHDLLSNLECLSISKCPMLKKRFLDREREYLSILSIIPEVQIDREVLCSMRGD